MDTYINSKGESILIKDMGDQHLINSIAKLAKSIGNTEMSSDLNQEKTKDEEMLKALRNEAIGRLSKIKEEKKHE